MPDIAVIDFGTRYIASIVKILKDLDISFVVLSPTVKSSHLSSLKVKGIILSGSKSSVLNKNSPKMDKTLFSLGVPILGICYGHQLLACLIGGKVRKNVKGKEVGFTEVKIKGKDVLFQGLNGKEKFWMRHEDVVTELPSSAKILASSRLSPIAAFKFGNIYGVQFHPEVKTKAGRIVIENFIKNVCKIKKG